MLPLAACALVINIVGAIAYYPHGSIGEKVQEPMLMEALLREAVDRMGRELNEPPYLEYPSAHEQRLAMMVRASNDLENEQLDYDSIVDGNPSPSLRDQEYLQHSALWGHQYVAGGAGEGKQHLKPSGYIPNKQIVKTDAVLPAYCNPPNPCPVEYSEEQGCIRQFENTAAFSREYQASQQCMCDREHMFSCAEDSEVDLQYLQHHKPYEQYKEHDENPFLTGERLPIAAKKGFEVY